MVFLIVGTVRRIARTRYLFIYNNDLARHCWRNMTPYAPSDCRIFAIYSYQVGCLSQFRWPLLWDAMGGPVISWPLLTLGVEPRPNPLGFQPLAWGRIGRLRR